jgi:hypothetical protein
VLSICDIFIGDVEHEIGDQLRSQLVRGVVRIRHIPLEVLLDHQPVLPLRQFHIEPQIGHVLDCLALPGQTESRPYNTLLNRQVGCLTDHAVHHECAKIAVRVQTQLDLALHDVYHVDAEDYSSTVESVQLSLTFDLTRI